MSKFVMASLKFTKAYDWQPNENFTIGFLGKTIQPSIDALSGNDLITLLNLVGVPTSKIISVGAYGSSADDLLELFFCYEGDMPTPRSDFWIQNGLGKLVSYAGVQAMIVTQFTKITYGMEAMLYDVAKKYQVRSFAVKPFTMAELPQLVIDSNPVNGLMADMRWISNSYVYVADFKRLNWATIYYKEANGKQKFITRPKSGW